MRFRTYIDFIVAFIGGLFSMAVGGFTPPIKALLIFMLLDYITGVFAAFKNNEVNSETGFYGLIKKLSIIAMLIIAHVCDKNIIGSGNNVRQLVTFFYLSNEGISLLENVARCGIPIPKKLVKMLEQLNEEEEKEE